MLNRLQLKKYRELRRLTTRDVANYCNISQPLIVQVENGTKAVTEYNHDEIINGIKKEDEVEKVIIHSSSYEMRRNLWRYTSFHP